MRVTLVEVPYDSGRYAERMGAGPPVLAAALPARLAALGHDVETVPVRLDASFATEVGAVVELQAKVRAAVATARGAGRWPVVLSGNCGVAALGATAALDGAAVVWLDAHGDLSTPETSPSGFFDGMCLAVLTGRCWRAVAAGLAGFAPVPDERVTLVGARDLDPTADADGRGVEVATALLSAASGSSPPPPSPRRRP